jgi:uncharacterized protein YukE
MAGSYKMEVRTGVVDDIESAFSDLVELRDEVQEIVDGASGSNLENTQRIQTFQETADALSEADSPPTVPDGLGDIAISYGIAVNKNKRRGPSRAARRDNAVAVLQGVMDALADFIDECDKPLEEVAGAAIDEFSDEQAIESNNRAEELKQEAEAFQDEVQTAIDNFEAAEFPGMFG